MRSVGKHPWIVMFVFAGFVLAPSGVAQGPSPPGEPLALVAIPDLDGSVSLTWQPPLDDGGAPITEYRVYRGEAGRGFELLGTSTSTSYVDPLAATGASLYLYEVAAVNVAGEGAPSGPTPAVGSCVDVTVAVPPGVVIDWACLGVCPFPQPLNGCITDIIRTGGLIQWP